MSSKSVTKPSANTVQRREVESKESHTNAEAKAGLNLNILGALSGSLGSRSSKTKETDPSDGYERSTEETHAKANAHGQGAANLGAAAAARGSARSKNVKEVDHLGLEG